MIGVFGGTFDPPHLGHAEAIQGVFDEPGLERLWVLPSGNPIGKKPTLSPIQRMELARLAFGRLQVPGTLEILDEEVRWSERHPGQTSTTWKVLPELERRAQGESLAWVIGTDQLASLHRWDRFPEVLSRISWIVLERLPLAPAGPEPLKNLSEWQASGLIRPDPAVRSRNGRTGYRVLHQGRPATTLIVVPTPAKALSSTHIREAFARDRHPPKDSLAPEVEAHLKLQSLYGSA